MPRPRKTLTEFEPVTLPIAASAVSSPIVAALEANVSGRDVPSATNVIAVTDGSSPMTQPKSVARSPMIAVTKPMKTSATPNVTLPSQ